MRANKEHTVFEIDEAGEGKLQAALSPSAAGISLAFFGPGSKVTDHIIFSLSPEDGREIGEVAETLTRAATHAVSIGEHKAKEDRQKWLAEGNEVMAEWVSNPRAPIVTRITEGLFDKRWELRGGIAEEEDVALGGLSWFRDRLDIRADGYRGLNFNPETFAQFAEIAKNQPNFPERTSVWDTPTA